MKACSISIVLLLLPVLGCVGEDDADETEEIESDLFVDQGIHYWDDTNYVVRVCWNTPGFQAEKDRIRDAITRTWQAASHLRFTGWDTSCGTSLPGTTVPLRLHVPTSNNDWGGVTAGPLALGWYGVVSYLDGTPKATVELTTHAAALEYVAIHEFGHLLGFVHEQQRPDRSIPGCPIDLTNANNAIDYSATYLTVYDPDSIMNYCRDGDHNGILDINEGKFVAELTPLDIAGVQSFYHAPGGYFGTPYKISDWFCLPGEDCHVADVNNDDRADLVAFTKTGPVWVAYGTPSGLFNGNYQRHNYFCVSNETCAMGDVNGDGMADLVAFTRTGPVYVAYATASGNFGAPIKVSNYFCLTGEDCQVADVNHDQRADLVAFTKQGPVWVAYATSSGLFTGNYQRHSYFCVGNEVCKIGDLNGDGWNDLFAITKTGPVFAAFGQTTGNFGSSFPIASSFCTGSQACEIADANGDGRADLIAFVKSDVSWQKDDVWVSLSHSGPLPPGPAQKWADYFCPGSEQCRVGMLTAPDGSADLVAFVGNGEVWAARAYPF